jgi:hypothetical protein
LFSSRFWFFRSPDAPITGSPDLQAPPLPCPSQIGVHLRGCIPRSSQFGVASSDLLQIGVELSQLLSPLSLNFKKPPLMKTLSRARARNPLISATLYVAPARDLLPCSSGLPITIAQLALVFEVLNTAFPRKPSQILLFSVKGQTIKFTICSP